MFLTEIQHGNIRSIMYSLRDIRIKDSTHLFQVRYLYFQHIKSEDIAGQKYSRIVELSCNHTCHTWSPFQSHFCDNYLSSHQFAIMYLHAGQENYHEVCANYLFINST